MLQKIKIVLALISILTGCSDDLFEELPENTSVRFFGTSGRDVAIDVTSRNNGIFILGSILDNGNTYPGIFSLDHVGQQKNQSFIIDNQMNNVVVDFELTDDNNIIVLANSLPAESNQTSAVHVIKTDINGNIIWQKDFIVRGNISSRQMLIHQDNIYIVGSIFDNNGSEEDGWLLMLDKEGTILQEHRYGGNLNDGIVSIVAVENDLLLLGNTQSFDIGNRSGDIWLIRTDLNGSIKGFNTFGTSGSDIALSLIKQSNNAVFVLGRSTKSLNGGDLTLVSCVNPVSLSVDWQKEYSADYSLSPQSMIWWNNALVVVQNEEISSDFTQIGFLYYNMEGELLKHNHLDGEIGISARKIHVFSEDEFVLIGTNVFRGASDIAFLKISENSEFF